MGRPRPALVATLPTTSSPEQRRDDHDDRTDTLCGHPRRRPGGQQSVTTSGPSA
jgi:hypothetical protein